MNLKSEFSKYNKWHQMLIIKKEWTFLVHSFFIIKVNDVYPRDMWYQEFL